MTRPILGHPAMLPYAVAAVAFTGLGCALLGYAVYQLWPEIDRAIGIAIKP